MSDRSLKRKCKSVPAPLPEGAVWQCQHCGFVLFGSEPPRHVLGPRLACLICQRENSDDQQ